jgi:UDP:flavonoid glycosyltransferase YjiC (YdhE family)
VNTILLAWELGGNLGHLGALLPIATALQQRGHQAVLALRNPAEAKQLLRGRVLQVMQAPVPDARPTGRGASASYAEILLKRGYQTAETLLPIVETWTRLIGEVSPDLLVADYAPTAMVAARGQGFPVALEGSGFFSPPRVEPIPAFRNWEPTSITRIVQSERLSLETINRVLSARGEQALGRLADLFDVAEDFLCTFPELDHYPGRTGQRYWDPLTGGLKGVPPAWPRGGGARVFGYLRKETPGLENVLAALREADLRALLFVPDVTPRLRKRWSGRNVTLSPDPVDLTAALGQADLFVGYAGPGTVSRALLAGIPILSAPMYAEQMITALNVQRLGAGLVLPERADTNDVRAALDRLTGDTSFREAAWHFAARHADYDPAAALEAIASRCEELLG